MKLDPLNQKKMTILNLAGVLIFCLFIGWVFYLIFGPQVIQAIYNGRSFSFLNNMFPGREIHPVEFYIPLFDRFMLNLAGAFVLFYCLVASFKLFLCREHQLRVVMVVVSVMIGLLMGESVLRLRLNKFYMWPPYMNKVFTLPYGYLPGMPGKAVFSTSSLGLRADELPDEPRYRILAIGGSTTISKFLDLEKTWPHLIQQKLNQQGWKVWVGNAGREGLTSRSHLVQMRYLLPKLPHVDAVIMLAGINDVSMRLSQTENFMPFYWEKEDYTQVPLNKIFYRYPSWKVTDQSVPFYKKSAIVYFGMRFSDILTYRLGIDRTEEEADSETWVHEARQRRKNATMIRRELPDLTEGLKEYTRNLDRIIDLAQMQGIRLILMTQPVLWGDDMAKDLKEILWFGWIGKRDAQKPGAYYSVEALSDAMGQYNKRLLEVCEERKVECIDLAAILPKDTTAFFDDCHFNENGDKLVARYVSEYLARKPELLKIKDRL